MLDSATEDVWSGLSELDLGCTGNINICHCGVRETRFLPTRLIQNEEEGILWLGFKGLWNIFGFFSPVPKLIIILILIGRHDWSQQIIPVI